ncbi:MAG TPA: enoyl-CoA hydratase/isomerase family protein, partial [Myxococcota bacterium]|nr:enoyl-CoA hydratase/isomerase family protein [Myxococcota bacterium]
MTPDLQRLHLTVDGSTAWLRLDHGKANEMGSEELAELDRLVGWLHEAPVAALVTHASRVTASGTHVFVAGANVRERVGWDDARVKAHVRYQRAVLGRLRSAPLLHVGVVAGVAFGWGAEYLLTCDYVIAVEGARFALPETGLGILPGAGGTSELQRRVGPAHALRLGLTGEA